MPTFKQPPASFRYLKARLNVLKRPQVWAAASGLMLLVFLVGAYLVNPQRYTGSNDLEAITNPPHQNPLGNLPTQNMPASNGELFETLPDLSAAPTQPLPDRQPQRDPGSPLLQEFLLGRSSVTAQPDKPKRSSLSSLFSASSENQRDPCGICGAARPPQSRSPSLYSIDSLSSDSLSSNPTSAITSGTADSSVSASSFPIVNPLQSALDRYSSIPNPSPTSPAQSLAQSLGADSSRGSEPRSTEEPISQDSWRQPESSLQNLPSPQFTPQLSPFPGTTGYTLPPTLRPSLTSVGSSFSGGSLQPIPGQIAPQTAPTVPRQFYDDGQSSYPNGQAAYPRVQSSSVSASPTPAPFSVPHAAPGRSIGGGQINTFSNP